MPAHKYLLLKWAIQEVLLQPPSAAGRRLASERKLCMLTGLSRVTVRKTIECLIADGILVRRHGSGTYVRKIEPPPADAPRTATRWSLTPAVLLADSGVPYTRLVMPEKLRSLRIHAWLPIDSEYSRLLIDGLQRRAQREGHRFDYDGFDGFEPAELARVTDGDLPDNIDAYVMHVAVADVFASRIAPVGRPVVYVGDGNRLWTHEPLVQLDYASYVGRALHMFHACGYRRIAMLNPEGRGQGLLRAEAYRYWIKQLGLRYRRIVDIPWCAPADKIREVRTLLRTAPRPEALLVADDILLREILPGMETEGCRPGREIAVITEGAYGIPLPPNYDWSVMQYNPSQVGTLIMDCLLREVTQAGEPLCSIVHHAAWRPGTTHLIDRDA
jgi:DNA-binding LacI/PurR family transcriptional regulator